MRRDELREDGSWHLPGSRTKNSKPHVVPLAPLAREQIASMNGTVTNYAPEYEDCRRIAAEHQVPLKSVIEYLAKLIGFLLAGASETRFSAWGIYGILRTGL